MIGFGENNKEFGKMPPYLISCEEIISDDDNFSSNAPLRGKRMKKTL